MEVGALTLRGRSEEEKQVQISRTQIGNNGCQGLHKKCVFRVGLRDKGRSENKHYLTLAHSIASCPMAKRGLRPVVEVTLAPV